MNTFLNIFFVTWGFSSVGGFIFIVPTMVEAPLSDKLKAYYSVAMLFPGVPFYLLPTVVRMITRKQRERQILHSRRYSELMEKLNSVR